MNTNVSECPWAAGRTFSQPIYMEPNQPIPDLNTLKAQLRAEILAKTDKERTDFWGGFFGNEATREAYEIADYSFVVPDSDKFDLYVSTGRMIKNWIVGLMVGTIYLYIRDSSWLIIGVGVFVTLFLLIQDLLKDEPKLILGSEGLELGRSPFVPWEDVLTLQFSDATRKHSKNLLILHYLSAGSWKKEQIDISNLNYERKQLAAIVLKFMKAKGIKY